MMNTLITGKPNYVIGVRASFASALQPC